MGARFAANADEDQLEELVARIQTQSGKPLPRPRPDALAQFLARTAQEVPLSVEELEEHERVWRAVDEAVQALEQPNGVVDG